jgi:AcrR family transcriptional regulator
MIENNSTKEESAMGIKQRRERERQEIRQSILSAAQAIAAEEGWQAVTTRKVAERIEYSQPTIYEYFENKQAILLALLHLGYERIRQVMQQAAQRTANPEERLLAISEAYWNFAFTSPELYQVMHGLQGVVFGQPDAPPEAKQTFALMRENVMSWAEATNTDLPHPDDAVDALWGVVHGLTILAMDGRIAQGPARAKQILLHTIRDLLFAWKEGPEM